MSCRRTQADLAAYLDDELPEALASAITEHLGHCTRCEAQLARLDKVHGALRAWEDPPVAADFTRRLAGRLDGERSEPGAGRPIGVEAAARQRAESDRAGRGAEWSGLRQVTEGGDRSFERRRWALGSSVRWLWAVAASIAIGWFLWTGFQAEEARRELPPSVDRSAWLFAVEKSGVPDRIHFVLPSVEEERVVVAEGPDGQLPVRPDVRGLTLLAALRRTMADPARLADEADDLAALAEALTGRRYAAADEPAPAGRLAFFDLPFFGRPAEAAPGSPTTPTDPDFLDGLAAYRDRRFDAAARSFDLVARKSPGTDLAASALAQEVRALAAGGRVRDAHPVLERLVRDYPLHRELAALLEARLLLADASRVYVAVVASEVAQSPSLANRHRLARAQVRAWDLPAAAETLERALADPAAWEDDPLEASRAALLLETVHSWLENYRAARSVAADLARKGDGPYRGVGQVRHAFLEAIVEGALADAIDPWKDLPGEAWRFVRAVVHFEIGREAIYRLNDPAAARPHLEAVRAADDGPLGRRAGELLDGPSTTDDR